MVLRVGDGKPSGDLPGTPSKKAVGGTQAQSHTPSQSRGPKSRFAPFSDDKKREVPAPEVPEWRIYKSGSKPQRRSTNVVKTNIEVIDKFFGGGIPKGLSIFVGEAGSGKSTLARYIAMHMKNVLYVVAEKQSDDPEAEGVIIMDYRTYLPKWDKALAEILVAAEKYNVDAIVVDSGTRLFSGTNKAVEEADLRPALFELARKSENNIPIIAISEVRGNGNWMYPAGGQAVAHAPILLVWFNKFVCRSDREADRFDMAVGEKVWTIEVGKDARNLAKSNAEYRVIYNEDGTLKLEEPEKIFRNLGNPSRTK